MRVLVRPNSPLDRSWTSPAAYLSSSFANRSSKPLQLVESLHTSFLFLSSSTHATQLDRRPIVQLIVSYLTNPTWCLSSRRRFHPRSSALATRLETRRSQSSNTSPTRKTQLATLGFSPGGRRTARRERLERVILDSLGNVSRRARLDSPFFFSLLCFGR